MNLSDALMNVTSSVTPYDKLDPIAVKAHDIMALCGVFSGQAKTAAIIGLLFTISAFFYFGRYRELFVQQLGAGIVWMDKFILISIAISFAVIITRLYYGG